MTTTRVDKQGTLFEYDEYGRQLHHQTSVDGYEDVKVRAGTQKHKILQAFSDAPLYLHGYTAEEAAAQAHLTHTMYWCRVTELRSDGLIQIVFDEEIPGAVVLTRPGLSGNERTVYAITDVGRAKLADAKR